MTHALLLPRIAAWPRPDAAAAALIDVAVELCERRVDGYLGVEHLMAAFVMCRPAGPLARWVVETARGDDLGFHAAASRLERVRAQRVELTPRLARWALALPHGFGTEDLAALIAELGSLDAPGPRSPLTLEVFGGPEDGRRLALAAGDTIGLAGGFAAIELYRDTPCTDAHLRDRHLVWMGRGRVLLHAPGRVVRCNAPGQHTGAGPVELGLGDVLVTTPATRLRAVVARPGGPRLVR